MGENPLNRSGRASLWDDDIVSTPREILGKFIRELHGLTTHVKILYKALYPSEIDENNMAPNTQHGKIILPEKLDYKENRFNNAYFDRTVWFIEDLVSHDRITFCERYLHLAGYEQMYDDIIRYFSEIENPISGFMFADSITGKRFMVRNIINIQPRVMCSIITDENYRRIMCHRADIMPKWGNG